MEDKRTGLRRHTRFGMTWGQAISIVTVLGAIITAWVSINIQVYQQKTINEQQEIRIQLLEDGRKQNAAAIQQLRSDMTDAIRQLGIENRDDHIRIMDKQDQMMRRINN